MRLSEKIKRLPRRTEGLSECDADDGMSLYNCDMEGEMSGKRYQITYPFATSVFTAKMIERTVPVDFRERLKRPLGRKLEGRVFLSEVGVDHFRVVTYPDQWEFAKRPFGGIKEVPVWKNPSCVYGIFHECDGHTVVDCIIDIYIGSKIGSVFGIFMGCLGVLIGSIGMLAEGFTRNALLAIGIFTVLLVRSALALQPHQNENEVLIKFMEDLRS